MDKGIGSMLPYFFAPHYIILISGQDAVTGCESQPPPYGNISTSTLSFVASHLVILISGKDVETGCESKATTSGKGSISTGEGEQEEGRNVCSSM